MSCLRWVVVLFAALHEIAQRWRRLLDHLRRLYYLVCWRVYLFDAKLVRGNCWLLVRGRIELSHVRLFIQNLRHSLLYLVQRYHNAALRVLAEFAFEQVLIRVRLLFLPEVVIAVDQIGHAPFWRD